MNHKNKSKKKLIILVLLLFMVIGITGYGAYSYFYTSGNFGGYDTISVASFDPHVNITDDFLGHGGSITLTCPESEMGSGTVNCTGELTVENQGETTVVVSVSNGEASVNELSSDAVTATPGTPAFVWDGDNSDLSIEPNDNRTLTITVPVSLTSQFADSDPHDRETPYLGEAIEVLVSFELNATQVH